VDALVAVENGIVLVLICGRQLDAVLLARQRDFEAAPDEIHRVQRDDDEAERVQRRHLDLEGGGHCDRPGGMGGMGCGCRGERNGGDRRRRAYGGATPVFPRLLYTVFVIRRERYAACWNVPLSR
jgi:hypothetical protein